MHLPITTHAKQLLQSNLLDLEKELSGDVLTYIGPIVDGYEQFFLEVIEELQKEEPKRQHLYVVLTTGGGSAIAVERYVNIIRQHYSEITFIIPNYAYSAGTIFCMSGDDIWMDYSSVLGPIDPQVKNREGKWVAALGYLDKVNELLDKAKNNELSQAEFLILKDIDLAELKEYEQAKELTIALLKKWLVKYKFKNWSHHRSDPDKKGHSVTDGEKVIRAEEIAAKLSDNNLWHSHGRPINLTTLREELKLEIQDFSDREPVRTLLRSYYQLADEYCKMLQVPIFVQTRQLLP